MKLTWITILTGAAVVLATLSGCRQINVAEVLRQPKNSGIYTNHNLWYNPGHRIPVMNYQSGKIIPFGTEVEIISAYQRKIRFRTLSDQQEYRIDFDPEWAMITMDEYIRQTFTLKDRHQLIADIPSDTVRDIDRGMVTRGMSRQEVLLTCGVPAACRTPSLDNDTWIYWVDRFSTIRVVFKDGRVIEILSLK